MSFGKRIKALRHMYDLTQDQFADLMGVDRSTYAYYENGKFEPTTAELQRLSQVFLTPMGSLSGAHHQSFFTPETKKAPTYSLSDSDNRKPTGKIEFIGEEVKNPFIKESDSSSEAEQEPAIDKTIAKYGNEIFELSSFEKDLIIRARILRTLHQIEDADNHTASLPVFLRNSFEEDLLDDEFEATGEDEEPDLDEDINRILAGDPENDEEPLDSFVPMTAEEFIKFINENNNDK